MKKAIKIILSLFALLILFVAALPSLLSTTAVKNFCLAELTKRTSLKITLDHLDMGWTKGLHLQKLHVDDEKGRSLFSCDEITLNDSLFTAIVSPKSFGHLSILQPQATLSIDAVQATVPEKESDSSLFIPYFSHAKIENGSLVIVEGEKRVGEISNLQLDLQLHGLSAADISLSATVAADDKEGSLSLHAALEDLRALQRSYEALLFPQQSKKPLSKVVLDCSVKKLPVAILDTLASLSRPEMKGALLTLCGPELTLECHHRLDQDQFSYQSTIESATIASKIELIAQKGALELPSPALFRLQFTPQGSALPLQLAIETNLAAKSVQELLHTTSKLTLSQGSSAGMIDLTVICKNMLSEAREATVSADLHGAWPALLDSLGITKELEFLVGKEIHATLSGSSNTLFSKKFQGTFSGNFASQAVQADIKGQISEKIAHLEDSTISYDLLPNQLQKFTKIELKSPLRATLHLDRVNLPLKEINFSYVDFSGTLSIPSIDLKELPQVEELQAKEITIDFRKEQKGSLAISNELSFKIPLLKEMARIHGHTVASVNSIKGTLEVTGLHLDGVEEPFSLSLPYTIEQDKKRVDVEGTLLHGKKECLHSSITASSLFSEKSPKIVSKGSFEGLPTQLITLLAKRKSIQQLFGNELTGKWDASWTGFEKPENSVRATVQGSMLSAGVNLQMDGERISGIPRTPPLWLKTALSYDSLKMLLSSSKLDHLSLKESAPVEFQLNRLEIPLTALGANASLTTLLDKIDIDATLNLGSLLLQSERSHTSHMLPPLQASMQLPTGRKQFICTVNSQKNETATELFLKLLFKNVWNDKELTIDKSDIHIESRLRHIPVDAVQLFTSLTTREKIGALLGESFDASFEAKVEELSTGTLQASIDADRLHSNVTCAIVDGVLTLPKPLLVKAIITKDAGKTLFQDVNPLLATSISTPHPVEITVDNKGFQIPLRSYFQNKDFLQFKRAIFVPLITLQIGKIRVQKGNTLSTVFSLLGLPDEAESELWLTPIYLQMQNGIITLKRSDTLVDNRLQIASWGIVDLIQDRVDMVIGIPGPSLKTALQLRSIDPHYMLQLPIRGTTTSASLDKTRAVAKIASLRMQQSSSDTQALLGGVLGLVAETRDPEAPVPAPTTVPFPWQGK